MSDEIAEIIETVAAGPRVAEGDGQKVVQHSIPDLIAADKHLSGKDAVTGKKIGIRLFKITPGGSA